MWTYKDNVRVFEHTMDMCNSDGFLRDSIAVSLENQSVIPSDQPLEVPVKARRTEVRFMNKRTIEATEGMQGRVSVLNFADYYVPGGLVKQGEFTQEEAICRITTLYPCISDASVRPLFYGRHRSDEGPYYSDDLIYTPGVIVFKRDSEPFDQLSRSDWHMVDVVTCAAPNLARGRVPDSELLRIQKSRFERIITVAACNHVDTLVLGAFGCGAFGNNPYVVASAARAAIDECQGAVGKIVFAIPGSRSAPNYAAFRQVFSDLVPESD